MTKRVTNCIYLKQCFFGFKMKEGKSLSDNLDDFMKLTQDMESFQITISYKNQAVILLNSLLKGNKSLVDTLEHGRQTLELKEIVATLMAKNVEKGINENVKGSEGLVMRGRNSKRSSGRFRCSKSWKDQIQWTR